MKRRCLFRATSFLLILLMLWPAFSLRADAAESQKIRVAWFYQPGYQELDENGSPCGFNYEYLMDIATYTGWSYDFVTQNDTGCELTWDDSLSMLASGELDLMGCLLSTEERKETYSYSVLTAGQIFTSLFVRNDSPLTGDDLAALDGLTVAACMAALNDEDLTAYAAESGFTIGSFLDCATTRDVIGAVLSGKADAGVLASYQPDVNTRGIASFAPRPFYFATAKGNTAILAALNQAMNAILISDPYYAQTLAVKYHQTYSGKAVFSQKELDYIASTAPIQVCFSNAWYPLIEYNAATGAVSGVVDDVMDKVSQLTGLQFEYHHVSSHAEALACIASGKYDMLACCVYNMRRAETLGATQTDSYLTIQLVRISEAAEQTEHPVIGTLADFPDYDNVMTGDNVSYRYYGTSAACFEALSRGEVDEIIVNSYSAGYYLSLSKYTKYIRNPLQGVSSNACMAVSEKTESHDLLLSILNKALYSISDAEINESILKNSIQSGGSLEAVINRIPTTVAAAIILVLVVVLLLWAALFSGFVRKSKQARIAAQRVNDLLVRDEMTGLLNGNGFNLAARESLDKYRDRQWYIVDFDVDGFEHINAMFGFERGNEILLAVARISREALRVEGELCARIFADHFTCLALGSSLEEITARVLAENAAFSRLANNRTILLSYGIYPVTDPSLSISAMCDRAQAAKRTVKGNYETIVGVFDEQFHERQLVDAELVSGMDSGLEHGEFVAYYQPKYDMRTEKIVGAEALVRWQRGEERIMPDRFIGLFEKNGLIGKLDLSMLDTVCRKLRAQLDAGVEAPPVSLNFSRNHLYDADFLEKLSAPLRRYQIPPELISVEFTEYACLENETALRDVICGIHALGMRVSIDDFGSGYSSLNMLKDLEFDEVKLDRGFLSTTSSVQRSKAVIEAVLALSKQLQLKTVAEGVEEKEQLDFLRESGCDIAQGYYFSPPVPESDYDALLLRDGFCVDLRRNK